jgi:hypothetical protein
MDRRESLFNRCDRAHTRSVSRIGDASQGGSNGQGEGRPEDVGDADEVEDTAWDDAWDDADDPSDVVEDEDAEDAPSDQVLDKPDDDSHVEDVDDVLRPRKPWFITSDDAYVEDVRAPRTSPVLVGLIGAAVGMLVMGLVWAGFALTGGDGSPEADPGSPVSNASQKGTVLGTEASAPTTPDRLAGCRAVLAAQRAPLSVAPRTLDQWEVHVGAMNKLVAGAISLNQATAFWNQTRVGAARNVNAFQAAAAGYHHTSARCLTRGAGGDQIAQVRSCTRAVAARNKVIHAAETSARTWDKHVSDMEMLRMGHLSPAKATAMWIASWRTGVHQLKEYHAAVRAMKRQHC